MIDMVIDNYRMSLLIIMDEYGSSLPPERMDEFTRDVGKVMSFFQDIIKDRLQALLKYRLNNEYHHLDALASKYFVDELVFKKASSLIDRDINLKGKDLYNNVTDQLKRLKKLKDICDDREENN